MVDVDDALTSREFFRQFPRPVRIQREVVPDDVRNQWRFVVGKIPAENFVPVELRDDDGHYSQLSPFELDALAECVETERAKSLRVAKHRTGTAIGLREGACMS
jgi:hypothetical protein